MACAAAHLMMMSALTLHRLALGPHKVDEPACLGLAQAAAVSPAFVWKMDAAWDVEGGNACVASEARPLTFAGDLLSVLAARAQQCARVVMEGVGEATRRGAERE